MASRSLLLLHSKNISCNGILYVIIEHHNNGGIFEGGGEIPTTFTYVGELAPLPGIVHCLMVAEQGRNIKATVSVGGSDKGRVNLRERNVHVIRKFIARA